MNKDLKIKIGIFFIVIILIFGICIYFYPRNYITVGIPYDTDNSTEHFLKMVSNELKLKNINLQYEIQSKEDATDAVSFLTNNQKIDFIINGNYGAWHYPTNKITSIGVVMRSPVLFFKNPKSEKAKKINVIDDVQGAKIIVYSRSITNPYPDEVPFWGVGVAESPNPYTSLRCLEAFYPFSLDDRYDGVPGSRGKEFSNEIRVFWPNLERIYSEKNQLSNKYKFQDAFLGDWDLLIILDPINDRLLKNLVLLNQLEFFQFDNIESVVQRNKYLSLYSYPKSTYSSKIFKPLTNGRQIPEKDIKILTYTNSINIKSSLDSSLIELLTDAVERASKKMVYLDNHGGNLGFLGKDINEFPKFSSEETFEPNNIAKKYYREGPSYLSELVTPSTASFLEKIALILVPLFTFSYPIFSSLPKIYDNFIKNKFFSWYKQLELFEASLETEKISKYEIEIKLQKLESDLTKIRIPYFYGDFVQDLYIAREHLALIAKKIIKD